MQHINVVQVREHSHPAAQLSLCRLKRRMSAQSQQGGHQGVALFTPPPPNSTGARRSCAQSQSEHVKTCMYRDFQQII